MATIQKRKRIVASYRIKQEKFERFKDFCKKKKLSHCKITEVLIDKFLRGEIMILPKDFDF